MGARCVKNAKLDGRDKNRLEQVELDEFEVPTKNRVAEYDPDKLAKNWNDDNKRDLEKKKLTARLLATWKQGILGIAVMILSTYVVVYYIVNVLVIQTWCARDCPTQYTVTTPYQDLMMQQAMLAVGNQSVLNQNEAVCYNHSLQQRRGERYQTYGCTNYEMTFATFAQKEMVFTRILTFLLGFYVSFTINRWWRQITSVPTIDGLCIALGSFIWIDPSKKDDEVFVKEGVTAKEFKHTIARYCLLSWTMVMTTVSLPLTDTLKQPIDFNKKGLINYEEYMALKTKHGGDAWKGKWALPLLWAGSMLCEASVKTKDTNLVKIKELKEIMSAIHRFQQRLSDVLHYDENQVPDIMVQAIRLGMWFWIIMGVFASQGMINKEFNVPLPIALIMNFPLLSIVKYVLLISWLKTAMYLQNPFGYDE